jgi:hypothetical protein
MVILLPKASAEKRTNEQPIGKISSFTPRDKASAAGGGGVDPIVRAMIVPRKPSPLEESYRNVCRHSSLRVSAYPGDRQPQASVLQPLYDADQHWGKDVTTASGN